MGRRCPSYNEVTAEAGPSVDRFRRGVGRGATHGRALADPPPEAMTMRFYTQQHRFYCGVDLHTRTLSLCVLDNAGAIAVEVTMPPDRDRLLAALAPYRDSLVVGCECLFAWYWLADLCAAEQISFVLGHALYLKAIHGGKTKTDVIDAQKLARLLRGGTFAEAYVYPKAMRATRDLLRRRTYLVRKRSELLAHLQMTFLQYNLTPPAQKLCYAANRVGLDLGVFADPSTRSMLAADLAIVTALDQQIKRLEAELVRTAKVHDAQAFHRLRTVPGIGPVLALIILYEVQSIDRFADEGRFLSYARLVGGVRESAGKKKGTAGRKMGNAHLKWALGEATCLLLRELPRAKTWLARRERKAGKKRALGALAARLGRTIYHLWRKKEAFDVKRFLAS
jgi:transposase